MATAISPAPPAPAGVDHIYCCDEDVAMCGADLSDVPEGNEFPTMCPTCVDAQVRRVACPVPGCRP
jgi:hypothetical protein